MLCWITRKSNKNTVDQQLEEQMRKNIQYYFEVLKRAVAVIKFLSERGLAFRGHEEKQGSSNNVNFMGTIKLIADFDPFLHKHLEKYKNYFIINMVLKSRNYDGTTNGQNMNGPEMFLVVLE